MRKIISFCLGVSIAYCGAYITLHSSFLMLNDWLGPVLGDSLLSALTVIYLILGSPTRFVALGFIWIFVGLLGGMIIRRRLGAILVMFIVFLIFIPTLAASIAGIGLKISEMNIKGENPFDLFPPLPQGFSMMNFFEAPIIGEVFQTFIDITGGEISNDSFLDIAIQLVKPLAFDLAVKLLLLIGAALVGVELGKMVEPFFTPYAQSIRKSMRGYPITQSILILLIIMSVSMSSSVFSTDEAFYGETIVAYIDEKGQVVMGNLFLDSEVTIGDIQWGSAATEGLLASILITHEGLMEDINSINMPIGFDIGNIIGVMPSTLLVIVYIDVPLEIAESRADTISSAFSSSMSIGVSKLFAFNQQIPIENMTEIPNISLVIYQSSASLEDIGVSYLEPFSHHEGLIEIIWDSIIDDTILPGSNSGSVIGSAFMTGFISPNTLIEEIIGNGLLPLDNSSEAIDEILKLIDGPVGFTGGFSRWENGYNILNDGYYFDILELLGYDDEYVYLSDDSDISIMGVFGPNEDEEKKGFTAISITNETGIAVENDLSTLGSLEMLSPGGNTLSDNFKLLFGDRVLPLLVEVTKTVTPLIVGPKGIVTVNVKIENMDTNIMKTVNLNDTLTLRNYDTNTKIISGSTSGYWSNILPGFSETISYTIEMGYSGVYTLHKADLTYWDGDKEYSKQSNNVEVTVNRPDALNFIITSYSSWWSNISRLLDIPTGGGGSMILILLSIIVIGILVISEVMNIRKWLKG